jgi:APA family basic amino acid/polyamine antiporter
MATCQKNLARVHPRTGTPLIATILIVVSIIPLAQMFDLAWLAESTSLATLVVFALVNLALLRLRYRGIQSAGAHVRVPICFPVAGFATCVAMISSALFM